MAVNDEYITRLQQGDITEIPPGTVGRMQFLMELADLEMLTWKFGDASGTSDVRVLRIGIYDNMQAKYKYYYFNCDTTGTLTETQGISTSDTSMAVQVARIGDESIVRVIPVAGGIGKDVRDVTTPLNVGGGVEYDLTNPRFFINGLLAWWSHPWSYSGGIELFGLKTKVYFPGDPTLTKPRYWSDYADGAVILDMTDVITLAALAPYATSNWLLYEMVAYAGYSKQNCIDWMKTHFPYSGYNGYHPYDFTRFYTPPIVNGGVTNIYSNYDLLLTEKTRFETYGKVGWNYYPSGTYVNYTDIITASSSYPVVSIVPVYSGIPSRQVGAKSSWGILLQYEGALFYGGKDYVNADYNSMGTTVPLSPFLNDFFIGKDLTNATISFYESEEE